MSIKFHQLSYAVTSLNGKRRFLFDNLSAEINRGELCAILGVNGSGKSTLLKVLAGLKKSLTGEVQIENKAYANIDQQDFPLKVSYLPQVTPIYYNLSSQEIIRLGAYPLVRKETLTESQLTERIKNIFQLLQIEHLQERKIFSLSGGEYQKVMLGRVLAVDSPYLLLDEPTAALDIQQELDLMENLKKLTKEQNKSIIAIMHDLELAGRYADKILLLSPGQNPSYYFGSIHEVYIPEILEKTFKVKMITTEKGTSFFPL